MDGSAASPADTSIADGLTPWLREATDDDGPFEVRPLAGGNSNETLMIESPSGLRVLRRPPAATIDASAHSVQREYRVLMALADTHVPVPRPIAVSRATSPGGPAGLLMEHVPGVSITAELPTAYAPEDARAVAEATIDALADLHALPWREVGLADFGRPDHFLERQVARWRRQYEACRHRELPDFERVATWLEGHRPPAGEPGILHGDFHVDNCLFSPESPARLLAVIDWEMSTIGDPLLDVGLLLALWGDERCEPFAMGRIQGFSRAAGAPTRTELVQRYELRSGRSLEHLHYYMALALWKLAAIVEGAHLHYENGTLETDYARDLEQDVPRLLADAHAFTELGG